MFTSQLVAALSAFIFAIRFGRALRIKRSEWNRYLKKSVSLGLCYAGFGTPGAIGQAWNAGKAGFICCAYDVVTDWRHFDPTARTAFQTVMRSLEIGTDLERVAMSLYQKEVSNHLNEDGLERGSIALRFTLTMMGCEKEREKTWGDVDEIGQLFQIVDDVLDYEDDIVAGDVNCLTSSKKQAHIRRLLLKFGSREVEQLFGSSRTALVIAIERARAKAAVLDL